MAEPRAEQAANQLASIVENQQRQTYGATAKEVFLAQKETGQGVRRFQQKRAEEQSRMQYMVVSPWSIINLMPFPLNVSGVIQERLRGEGGHQVPPAPLSIPHGWKDTDDVRYGTLPNGVVYVQKIVREPQWSNRDEGATADNIDNYTPISHLPAEIVKDFDREFIAGRGWGVLIYQGDHEPTTPGLKHKLQEALIASNRVLRITLDQGNSLHASGQTAAIKNNERAAAEMLLERKVITKPPVWLTITDDISMDVNPCPNCGTMPHKAASVCKSCPYVFSPLKAYDATLIEYGHMSFDRLTVDEWQEANKIKAKRDKARAAATGVKA